MAEEGRGFAQVVMASPLPDGVSWGSTQAVVFAVGVDCEDEGVQPTLTIENGLCVDEAADPGGPPMKTENTADNEKPPVKPADGEDEGR